MRKPRCGIIGNYEAISPHLQFSNVTGPYTRLQTFSQGGPVRLFDPFSM